MAQPVYEFLEEFGDEDGDRIDIADAPLPTAAPPPDPDILAAQLDEAYAKGVEAGDAEARRQMETELARIQSECDQKVEEAKSVFSDTVAELLSNGLRRQIDELHIALADQLFAALCPVMVRFLTEDAIRELVEEMRRLAKGRDAVSVELSGPAELIEKIWGRYCEVELKAGENALPEVRFSPADAMDVRVTMNELILEMRLMEWIGRIMEVAG